MKATFDGACEPFNPGGHMGLGWVVDGIAYHAYIAAESANSNNVAEYLALERVLDAALAAKVKTLTVGGDSQLVVNQLNGEFAVKSQNILPYYTLALDKLATLHSQGCEVAVLWHPRERNQAADAASKAALSENGVTMAQRSPSPGWGTLTEAAKPLGLSAIALGRRLTALGYREGDKATKAAIEAGLAQERFNGFGMTTDWNIKAVAQDNRKTGRNQKDQK